MRIEKTEFGITRAGERVDQFTLEGGPGIVAKLIEYGATLTSLEAPDREGRAGQKFAEMDLIGLPWQLIVGPRGLDNGVIELKNRASGAREELSPESALARLTG